MSFGQSSGPPASPKQIAYLSSLLAAAGYDDFRTARHVYGLTQRQAAGKFSGRDASALIDRLLGNTPDEPEAPPDEAAPVRASRLDSQTLLLRGIPADALADELRRRGWTVTEP